MTDKVTVLFLVRVLLLHRSYGAFTGFPPNGNRLEFKPLVLQWSHSFADIRGCVWSYTGGTHTTDFTFISYGTKEGLQIHILGWEVLDYTRPCAGGIVKKNSTLSDEGRYEMRVVAGSIARSKTVTVGIINPKDRSVYIQIGSNATKLIPDRDDHRTLYVGSDGRCVVILNDKYPDDTCTTVHRIGQNQSDIICNKMMKLTLGDIVTHVQISVNLDIVDRGPFILNFQTKGQPESLGVSTSSTSYTPCTSSWKIAFFSLCVITILLLVILAFVLRFLKKRIELGREDCHQSQFLNT